MIDWAKFAERVPAGALVRCIPSPDEDIEGKIKWAGLLIDNLPMIEERVIRTADAAFLEHDYKFCEEHPMMRIQDFEDHFSSVELFDPLWESVQFLVDGRWLTFGQVMS